MPSAIDVMSSRTVTVRGSVSVRESGKGAPETAVHVYLRTNEGDVLVGSRLTDRHGDFKVSLPVRTSHAEDSSKLVLRAMGGDGGVLGESEPIALPRRSATVHFDVAPDGGPGASELARVLARTAKHLGERRLSALPGRALKAVAKASHESYERVATAARAERMSLRLGIPVEPLYALALEAGVADIDALAEISPGAVRHALRSAVRDEVILDPEAGTVEALLERLEWEKSKRTPVSDLLPDMPADIAKDIRSALEQRKIATLADLRNAGGLGGIDGLDGLREQPGVKEVDAHVHLSVLTPDAKVRRKLIAAGLPSISAIAAMDASTLTRRLQGKLSRSEAAALHEGAVFRRDLADNALAGWRAADPNGVAPSFTMVPSFIMPLLIMVKCGCEECESAVSPLSYLAELMKYGKDNLRDTARPALRVDWHYLERHLHQPFGKLPATCESVETKVRQVRIAIEVLRSHLAQDPPTAAQRSALNEAERRYLGRVYESLLTGSGTSSAEIRLVQAADQATMAALRDRLGLPKAGHSVGKLLLDTKTQVTEQENAILERHVEEVFGLRDTRRPPLQRAGAPQLVAWRKARLRELWDEQDWPEDLPGGGRPIVDPDVVSPDDFRNPETNNHPFRLWRKRRTWVDDRLADLGTLTVEEIVDWMYSAHDYPLSHSTSTSVKWPAPRAELREIHEQLAEGQLDPAAQTRFERYGLEVDALNRLMELRRKEAEAADPRNTGLDEAELSEARSILVQALKRLLFAEWRKEEIEQAVKFGPQDFWISLREPVEDEWPPVPWPRSGAQVPFIDPELLRPSDLPDSTLGDPARTLYSRRSSQVEKLRDALKEVREDPAKGFAPMLEDAFGRPLSIDLDQTLADLASSDATTSSQAEAAVRDKLHLSIESFRFLMQVRAKDAGTDLYRKPTAAEYRDVYRVLATAQKARVKYPEWYTEEIHDGLRYWEALKARLPRWRASAEVRGEWQKLLRLRMSPPIIDPDLVSQDYLVPPRGGTAAWNIWTRREAEIDAARRHVPGGAGLDAMLQDTLGVSLTELLAIDDARKRGEPIARRLDQLFGLSTAAFDRLVRAGRLIRANQSVQPDEWNAVYDILTQAWKVGKSLDWRIEERSSVTLGPDYFRLPPADPLAFPPAQRRALPEWRASLEALLSWEDTLTARIDQDEAVADGLAQVVAAAEEARLPELRDALVAASTVPAAMQGQRAEWLSDLLLIDMKGGGCATTTRVAQAIETVQSLVFLIRSGQIRDFSPFAGLVLKDGALAAFDEDWAWMGSYATWRAAMFVFLYPENILLPSLLTDATPSLTRLIRHLRAAGRVTPEQARDAASMYEDYCGDVLELEAPWAVSAETRPRSSDQTESRLFLISRSARSDKVYWCSRAVSSAPSSQTFWDEVPGLKAVVRLVGVVEYEITPATRYLFVFAETAELGERKLVFSTYDLERRGWTTQPTELKTPDDRPFPTEIKLVRSPSTTSPPALFMRFPDGSDGTRSLGSTGRDWQREPLAPVNYEEELAAVIAGRRHEYAGVDGMTPLDSAPQIDRVMNWLVAANDHATKAEYAAGFPSFRQQTDIFEIIALTDVLVEVRSANDFFDSYVTVNSAPELSLVVRNSYFLAKLEGYIGAIPLFAKANNTFECDKFACFKDLVPDVSTWGTSFRSYPNDLDASTPSIRPAKDASFMPSDAARRFTWAVDQLQSGLSPGPGLLGFPVFSDSAASAPDPPDPAAYRDYITYFPKRRFISRPVEFAVSEPVAPPYKPQFDGALAISPDDVGTALEQHRSEQSRAYAQNAGASSAILTYFDEAWYFFRVHIALQLQRAGYYREALDWFRLVYDYTAPADQARIATLLVRERPPAGAGARQGFDDYRRDAGWAWLRDPLSPHRIARTRPNAYTRFTLLAIIRCQLEYGESEYTRDTVESVPLSRLLFGSALELLENADLVQRYGNRCDDVIGRLELKYGDEYFELLNGTDDEWASSLAVGAVEELGPKIERILASRKSRSAKRSDFAALVSKASSDNGVGPEKLGDLLEREAELHASATDAAMLGPAVADFASDDPAATEPARLRNAPVVRVPAAMITACIPPNPLLRALRLRAEANLYKIRTCRNIAGVRRELDAYSAPTDTTSGMPSIGAGGQLTVPGVAPMRPTPYRYTVVIQRAKEMVQLAQQLEGAMLSALQQRDSEAYGLMRARQDVRHSHAVVTLQDLRITEANDEVELAELQRDRASIQMQTYEDWINQGLLDVEKVIVAAYIVGAVAQAANAIASPWAGAASPQSFGFAAAAAASGAVAAAAQGVANVASVYGNLERRKQEWSLGRDIARQDIAIGNQQIRVANDRKQIVGQENVIAQLDADNAERTVEFLAGKFTNAELYDWMAGVLEGVYRYFLQQATAMAQLAASQLAFERQETPPPYIQSDYWEPLEAGGSSDDGASRDRRGLTGSARLLQDIYQLDQYWFETNQRKLQLTKTFSLAQLAPIEFQRFRETGVITFATAMEHFDGDFPGHYLRLIKRVRTSVVALVPPTEGIKATLTSARVSRVVTGGDMFQTVRVQHGPDTVALTSPREATGVFELEPQAELLAPFEGIGVDALWEFRMLRAANPIDYDAIADVRLTIDYTALQSFDYGQQLVQTLSRTATADRAYSFRNELTDAWWDLHNPGAAAHPMTASFRIERGDYPPNLDDLRIAQLALFFAPAKGANVELQVTGLSLTPDGGSGKVGGAATTSEGLISTRRGNAGSWMALLGRSPIGTWELALPDDSSVRRLFEAEEIADILLVVTYAGRRPAWSP